MAMEQECKTTSQVLAVLIMQTALLVVSLRKFVLRLGFEKHVGGGFGMLQVVGNGLAAFMIYQEIDHGQKDFMILSYVAAGCVLMQVLAAWIVQRRQTVAIVLETLGQVVVFAILVAHLMEFCMSSTGAGALVTGTLIGLSMARFIKISSSCDNKAAARRTFNDGGGYVTKSSAQSQLKMNTDAINAADSALHENIHKKGENSYYYAHAKTPTSQNINKGEAPVRLETPTSSELEQPQRMYKTIRKYYFSNGKKLVTIYIDLEHLDLDSDSVQHEVEFSDFSVQLVINESHRLQFSQLKHEIIDARSKLNSKGTRVSLILEKKDPSIEWASLT